MIRNQAYHAGGGTWMEEIINQSVNTMSLAWDP
jgi:hypothetical protein